ncbi:MAG TPA: serine hydrolase, partial [Salinimicrobium sp.]|nr:serine hydrolase [Salinimicrobium sp.]
QNVHWVDPDWNSTWGLGFSVYQGPGGDTWVSHGGSCPGYRTVIQMNPSEKRAYVVMINAGGESPGKYARGIHNVLQKYEKEKDVSDSLSVDLEQYRGFYNAQPWSSELYVTPWKGKLAVLYLPTDNPANAFSLFKHVEGDTFIRIRDNGETGETLTFERDENGNITRFERNGNYKVRLDREYDQN